MSLCFVFLDVTDKTSIGHFFVSWYRRFFSEIDGVGAFNSVANTLCETSELIGEGGFPSVFIFALYEVEVFLGLISDWMSDGIGFRDCNVVCLIGIPVRDGVWPTGVAASLVPWRPFHPWRWCVGLEADARHPS